MRRDFVENIILGVSIGAGVVAVKLFTVNTEYNHWILLGIVAILLSLLQIFFIMLRKRSGMVSASKSQKVKKPPLSKNGVSASSVVQRTSSSDLFARELDHNWTGLETADDQPLSSSGISDKPSSSDMDTPPTDEVLEKDYPRSYL